MESTSSAATPTVELHQFVRWSFGPNASTPCMKVESYLRLCKIPHSIVNSSTSGANGAWPFVRLSFPNGRVEEVCESQRIIARLKDLFPVCRNTDANLTEADRVCGEALRTVLEHSTYFCTLRRRWVENFIEFSKYVPLFTAIPRFARGFVLGRIRKSVITQLNYHGCGDLTVPEYQLLEADHMKYVAHVLGTKPFLFGDHATSYDCCCYAVVQNVLDCPIPGPARDVVQSCAALVDYCARMEALLYPDMASVKKEGEKTIAAQV